MLALVSINSILCDPIRSASLSAGVFQYGRVKANASKAIAVARNNNSNHWSILLCRVNRGGVGSRNMSELISFRSFGRRLIK